MTHKSLQPGAIFTIQNSYLSLSPNLGIFVIKLYAVGATFKTFTIISNEFGAFHVALGGLIILT